MGTVIVKWINKSYRTDEDILNLVKYIAGECENKEKTRYVGGKGISKVPEKAVHQMIKIQGFYGKATNRRIRQLMVSFPAIVDDANAVKLAAESISEDVFTGYQVFYGVHEDKENLHIHFAVNKVSYIDGRKWHIDKAKFRDLQKQISGIALECLK